MAASCRFAFAVHVLAVLAHHREAAASSDLLARSVNTNAVVIRRILAELRRAGLVETRPGAGGGARLAEPPEAISLDAVYRALACGPSFAPHPRQPNHRCPVGRGIESVLNEVFSTAQGAFEAALSQRTLADVLEEVCAEPAATRAPRSARPPRRA
jgi:Rrf2 family protein